MHTTVLLAMLAEARLARGKAEEGLATIEAAFAERTGERYLEAELHRLRGEWMQGLTAWDTKRACSTLQHSRDACARDMRSERRDIQGLADGLRERSASGRALMIQGPTVGKILEEADQLQADTVVVGSH